MDWHDLAGLGADALDAVPLPEEESHRESPNVVICGWMGAFAGAVVGVLLALALLHPIPPAGAFDLSLDSMTRQRLWGALASLFGGMVLGATIGRVVARRYID